MIPTRKMIDETCPSPVARRLITNRTEPGGTPSCRNAGTIEGLKSATDSRAYSIVKQAPSKSRRDSRSPGHPGTLPGSVRNGRRRSRVVWGAWAGSRPPARTRAPRLRSPGILKTRSMMCRARSTLPVPKNLMMTRLGSGVSVSGRRSTAIGTASLEGSTRGRRCGLIGYHLRGSLPIVRHEVPEARLGAACEEIADISKMKTGIEATGGHHQASWDKVHNMSTRIAIGVVATGDCRGSGLSPGPDAGRRRSGTRARTQIVHQGPARQGLRTRQDLRRRILGDLVRSLPDVHPSSHRAPAPAS